MGFELATGGLGCCPAAARANLAPLEHSRAVDSPEFRVDLSQVGLSPAWLACLPDGRVPGRLCPSECASVSSVVLHQSSATSKIERDVFSQGNPLRAIGPFRSIPR